VTPEDRAHPGETTAPAERGEPDPRHLRPDQRHPEDVARRERYERDLADAGAAGADADDAAAGTGETSSGDGEVPPALRSRAPGRALLTVSMPFSWLRSQIGHGLVDAEEEISPAEVRRLACDSGIVPMVLGTRSEPLDVGRMSYTIPEAIRRALVFRDRGCTFRGCNRRPERCHAHHVHHWADGGETCLANLTLLCSYHHHLVHHGDWVVTMIEGRPWFTPPAWIDPERDPIPGGPGML
jgi:hypothetical protein